MSMRNRTGVVVHFETAEQRKLLDKIPDGPESLGSIAGLFVDAEGDLETLRGLLVPLVRKQAEEVLRMAEAKARRAAETVDRLRAQLIPAAFLPLADPPDRGNDCEASAAAEERPDE